MAFRTSRRAFALGGAASVAAAPANARTILPSLIVHGGPIYTGVTSQPMVEAVRIERGRFVALGTREDVWARGARAIDLAGAAAFPGFRDAHVHLSGVGMAAMLLDLVGVASIAELQARLRAYAARHREGAIVGRGWIETHWPERRFPNRADLDAIVGDRPVFLERIDGHAAIVNAAALALAGVDANTPNPAGGAIERDAAGAATGMLIDNAMALVQSQLPAPTRAMQREALAQAMRLYASRGWTGVANMSTTLDEHIDFLELDAESAVSLDVDLYMTPPDRYVEAQRYWERIQTRGGGQPPRVRVRGAKLYMDGALGSRGAALLAPYSDAASDGLLVTPGEELRLHLSNAREYGLQVALHAIGDRGNRLALDAFRDAFADDPAALRAARWRIEHAQVIDPADVRRFAAMGVIASMQPSHAISDLHFASSRLGSERLAGAYAWRSLLDSGAIIAAGSDAPVERGDPLIEFYAACHRHDLNGFAGPDWHLEQRVSRAEALRMLTWGGAYAAFGEAERGTIEIGKRADLSVFSADLMTVEPAEIPRARAVLAMVDGRVTHNAL
jgi:hypothetical protein